MDRLVNVPVVRDIVNLPFVHSIIAGLLPSLVLRVFLLILPYLLGGLALFEGAISTSGVQFETMTKYFAFQVRVQILPTPFPIPGFSFSVYGLSFWFPRCKF